MKRGGLRFDEQEFAEHAAKRTRWQSGEGIVDTSHTLTPQPEQRTGPGEPSAPIPPADTATTGGAPAARAPAPFRLTRPTVPEAAILPAVLQALRLHPFVAWCERMNRGSGRFVRRDGSLSQWIEFGFDGQSDIMGQLITGPFLAVECKRIGENPTDAQATFLELVRRHGGVAFVARSVDDVWREMAGV